MRTAHLLPLLASALLAACATPPAAPKVSQTGPLKVHPGLLGMPVPPELQQQDGNRVARVDAQGPETMKLDEAGLRTQRSVYFDFNSAVVKADFNPLLQAHARYLAQHPKAKVRIEGNADERGPEGFNKRLGLQRAESVRQSLVDQGAPDKQVKVVTYGEAKPKLKGHDEESWAENRRADITYEKED